MYESDRDAMNLKIILPGLFGTLAMTLFIDLLSIISNKPLYVIKMLAKVLEGNGRAQPNSNNKFRYPAALIVHYSIGILFAFLFHQLVKVDIIQPTLQQSVIFGALAGLVGIFGWRIAFVVHPAPPHVVLSQFFTAIWVGHLIFALGVFIVYQNAQ